jgi:hypothetical protein
MARQVQVRRLRVLESADRSLHPASHPAQLVYRIRIPYSRVHIASIATPGIAKDLGSAGRRSTHPKPPLSQPYNSHHHYSTGNSHIPERISTQAGQIRDAASTRNVFTALAEPALAEPAH